MVPKWFKTNMFLFLCICMVLCTGILSYTEGRKVGRQEVLTSEICKPKVCTRAQCMKYEVFPDLEN